MPIAFDEVKATQTAAMFLRLAGGKLNYVALIKLLYKTDREALKRWGISVTTDSFAALSKGPIVSKIYDRIKASKTAEAHPTYWSDHISSDGSVSVEIANDPGDGELSRAEEQLVAEIFKADGHKDRFELVAESHEFPEWIDPQRSSRKIEIDEILDAVGASEDDKAHAAAAIGAQCASRKLAIS